MKKKTIVKGSQIPAWLWIPLCNHSEKGWNEEKQSIAEAAINGLKNCLRFQYIPLQDQIWLTEFDKNDDAKMYGVNGKTM